MTRTLRNQYFRIGMILAMLLVIVAACDGGGRHVPF